MLEVKDKFELIYEAIYHTFDIKIILE
jgi:hypothetical protein